MLKPSCDKIYCGCGRPNMVRGVPVACAAAATIFIKWEHHRHGLLDEFYVCDRHKDELLSRLRCYNDGGHFAYEPILPSELKKNTFTGDKGK